MQSSFRAAAGLLCGAALAGPPGLQSEFKAREYISSVTANTLAPIAVRFDTCPQSDPLSLCKRIGDSHTENFLTLVQIFGVQRGGSATHGSDQDQRIPER